MLLPTELLPKEQTNTLKFIITSSQKRLLLETLLTAFNQYETQAQKLVGAGLPLPAYEMVLKASHTFNLLDARQAISVTERQRYILRVRKLAQAVAKHYYEKREAMGFPLLKKTPEVTTHE